MWAGVNDQTAPQADIAAAAATAYEKIRTGSPATKTYVVGPWSPSGSPGAGLVATDETLRAAAQQAGLPFVSTITGKLYDATGALILTQRPWITGTGRVSAPKGDGNADSYVGADGVHPTDAGQAYVGRRMALALEQIVKRESAPGSQN
jgi:lysophospholipase L1-like esterase